VVSLETAQQICLRQKKPGAPESAYQPTTFRPAQGARPCAEKTISRSVFTSEGGGDWQCRLSRYLIEAGYELAHKTAEMRQDAAALAALTDHHDDAAAI